MSQARSWNDERRRSAPAAKPAIKRKPLNERSSNPLGPTIRIVDESPNTKGKSIVTSNDGSNSTLVASSSGFSLPRSTSETSSIASTIPSTIAGSPRLPWLAGPRSAHRIATPSDFSQDDTLAGNDSPLLPRLSFASTTPSSPTLFDADRVEQIEKQFGTVLGDYRERVVRSQSTIRILEPSSPASHGTDVLDSNTTVSSLSPTTSIASLHTLTTIRADVSTPIAGNYDILSTTPTPQRSPSTSRLAHNDSPSFRGLDYRTPSKRLPRPDLYQRSQSQQSPTVSTSQANHPEHQTVPAEQSSETHVNSGEDISHPDTDALDEPASPTLSYTSSRDDDQVSELPQFTRMVDSRAREQWNQRLSGAESDYGVVGPYGGSSIGLGSAQAMSAAAPSSVALALSSHPVHPPKAYTRPLRRAGKATVADVRDFTYGESDDIVTELYSPWLRSQPSYFSIFSSGDSRPSTAASAIRALSRHNSVYGNASYMESGQFPAWARSFYRRGSLSLPSATDSTTSLSVPVVYAQSVQGSVTNTAINVIVHSPAPSRTPSLTDRFPLHLFHPRKRPRKKPSVENEVRPQTNLSYQNGQDELVPMPLRPGGKDLLSPPQALRGPRPPSKVPQSRKAPARMSSVASTNRFGSLDVQRFSLPRLTHDRRSVGVIYALHAPSMGSSLDRPIQILSERGNRQVGLFALGFVFPLAWIVAAFLPLPELPSEVDPEKRRSSDLWMQTRLNQLEQGSLMMSGAMSPDQRSRISNQNANISYQALDRALDGSQTREVVLAREEAARRLQQDFGPPLDMSELEKLEAQRRHAKQKWWRRVNRYMAVLGLLVTAMIIALVVVAAKHNI